MTLFIYHSFICFNTLGIKHPLPPQHLPTIIFPHVNIGFFFKLYWYVLIGMALHFLLNVGLTALLTAPVPELGLSLHLFKFSVSSVVLSRFL